MEGQLELLKQLQDIDSIVSKIEKMRSEVPKRLDLLEKEHELREQQLERSRTALEKVNEERRRVELKLKEETERVQKSEEKIHLVKTNKEYQAVLKEIEDIKRESSNLETRILVCMDEADRLTEQLKKEEAKHKEWVQGFEEKKKELESEVRHSEEEAIQLNQRRVEMLKKIESPLINKYELLRKRRQGLAVVEIIDGLCQGCNMNIPPQRFNELLKNIDSIMDCPFCNRIIYSNGN